MNAKLDMDKAFKKNMFNFVKDDGNHYGNDNQEKAKSENNDKEPENYNTFSQMK
jgi:hypothetical protein